MSQLLDYIVSETWAFMTVFILFCTIPTIMIMWRPFKNLVAARITQITISAFSFVALMYLLMSEHGYAVAYVGALSNGKELCLVEQHYEGDGDGGSWEAYRLYVLDLETGEQILRTNLNSPSLLCVTDHSAIFSEGSGAIEYDLHDGSTLRTWNEETGFEKYRELKCGIMSMNTSTGAYEFKNEGWLTITAKDGHHYCYDLLNDQLIAAEYPPSEPYNAAGYKLDSYQLTYTDPKDGKSIYYSFQKKTGDIQELVFRDKDYTNNYYEGEYLDPEIIAFDESTRIFVIRHYETLERQHAIFSAVTFDLKPSWRVEQRKVLKEDRIGENPLPGIAFKTEDKLIATFGGAVICIRISDGSVLWQTAL